MNKAILILKREYLTRVKKKSFILMTLLMPVFMAAIFIIPTYIGMSEDKKERVIAVYDESSLFLDQLKGNEHTKLIFVPSEEYQQIKNKLKDTPYYALLYIPANILASNRAQLFSEKQVTFDVSNFLENRIEDIIERDKRNKIIEETGVPDLEKKLATARTDIKLSTLKIEETGKAKENSSVLVGAMGYIMGFLIYMFMFMYGMMVMRGVMEEKSSRVVEVIISSVKPVQLMFGKIIGIALVGLTQIAIWIVLGAVVITGIGMFFGAGNVEQVQQAQNLMNPGIMGNTAQIAVSGEANQYREIMEMAGNLPVATILFSFVFYFLGGYLLYSSLLAAVGSAVDSEEDSQQLVFPVILPLILSIMLLFPIAKNPEGPLAFWTSMIPFTSPIIMLARIPYGIPWWELALSMFLLVIAIIGSIWMAARIYRTGILMYGKKVNLKELVKWLRYRS
ncbi:MAG: ABC transporter permease [Prolixibacteraceae bacterium]|jgi:ABC-2 type transport system permease protein|nr:ABC transporter permease [Prolixibacteraceae bacterium]